LDSLELVSVSEIFVARELLFEGGKALDDVLSLSVALGCIGMLVGPFGGGQRRDGCVGSSHLGE
jgi:hypothetical protein